ncbi:MAG: hypothetical protein O9320_05480 [Magnetospirillum sp.]|nr:hypothetical protein [Magnetospirillum sp.]
MILFAETLQTLWSIGLIDVEMAGSTLEAESQQDYLMKKNAASVAAIGITESRMAVYPSHTATRRDTHFTANRNLDQFPLGARLETRLI